METRDRAVVAGVRREKILRLGLYNKVLSQISSLRFIMRIDSYMYNIR